MTAIEVIAALEKALEAGPHSGHLLATIVEKSDLRSLLDAHASALRDAARYRWLRSKGILLAGHDFISFDETADFRIDRAMAALDDNTKGAAE